MEEVVELVQQNWRRYEVGDLSFLEKLDKKQIIMLFEQYVIDASEYIDDSECYYCLHVDKCKYYGELDICKSCAEKNNYINLKCCRLEKDVIDLKKHIIGINKKGKYSCMLYGNIESANTFPMRVKNQQWYNHCFGVDIELKNNDSKCAFVFLLSKKSHYKLFMQCTRFNHYSKFISISDYENCRTKNYDVYYNNTESSVEEVMTIIDTARLIFRQFRVPKCIRNLLIEWFLV